MLLRQKQSDYCLNFKSKNQYSKKYFSTKSFETDYNWVDLSKQEVQEVLFGERKKSASKKLVLTPLFSLSKNFWKALLMQVSPDLPELPWAKLSKEAILQLAHRITHTELSVTGKSTNKEEFVTCGGVSLKEVDPKTFQSKKVPGLYFAGELLDIDGVTGGFNFQNAWSSGYLAAQSMVS